MKKRLLFVVLAIMAILAVALLTGCAAGANPVAHAADAAGKTAGFWSGLWHGFISPVTFIISLFSKNVNIYEVHNNGNWYNFGFILGVMMIFGGGGAGAKRKYK
jgi:hypothetical protein